MANAFMFVATYGAIIAAIILHNIVGSMMYRSAVKKVNAIVVEEVLPEIKKEREAGDAALTEYKKDLRLAESENKRNKERAAALIPRINKCKTDIRNNNVLSENDKRLEDVSAILYLLESRRADSIKEALNLRDELKRQDAESRINDMWAALAMKEAAKAAQAQADHNAAMEDLRRSELDELRKINRMLKK